MDFSSDVCLKWCDRFRIGIGNPKLIFPFARGHDDLRYGAYRASLVHHRKFRLVRWHKYRWLPEQKPQGVALRRQLKSSHRHAHLGHDSSKHA